MFKPAIKLYEPLKDSIYFSKSYRRVEYLERPYAYGVYTYSGRVRKNLYGYSNMVRSINTIE